MDFYYSHLINNNDLLYINFLRIKIIYIVKLLAYKMNVSTSICFGKVVVEDRMTESTEIR